MMKAESLKTRCLYCIVLAICAVGLYSCTVASLHVRNCQHRTDGITWPRTAIYYGRLAAYIDKPMLHIAWQYLPLV